MTYMLLIYTPNIGRDHTDAEWAEMLPPFAAYNEYVKASGFYVDGAPLAELEHGDDRARCATASARSPTARSRRPKNFSAATTSSNARRSIRRIELAAAMPGSGLRLDRSPAGDGHAGRGACRLTSRSGIARCFRDDAGRAVASLARAVGDLELAEDAVADAYVVALERWPHDGFPAQPSAWILTTARRRAIDRLRRERVGREKLAQARRARCRARDRTAR